MRYFVLDDNKCQLGKLLQRMPWEIFDNSRQTIQENEMGRKWQTGRRRGALKRQLDFVETKQTN